jgi:hypothetical protein
MPKLISVGEIIDRSWETYRAGFMDFMSVSGWLLLVALVDVVALVFYPLTSKVIGGAPLTGMEQFGVTLYWISRFILAPVISLWMFLALAKIADARLIGRRLTLQPTMRESWRQFWPAVLVAILVMLVLLAAFVIGFVPGGIVGALASALDNGFLASTSSILLAIGSVVSACLLLYAAVSYAFAGYAVALDDARGRLALMQSRSLVRGRFWSVVWRLAIPNAAFIILGLIASIALGVVGNVVLSAFTGLNLEVLFRLKSVLDSVFPTIVAILLNPIITIANVIVYRSLKG